MGLRLGRREARHPPVMRAPPQWTSRRFETIPSSIACSDVDAPTGFERPAGLVRNRWSSVWKALAHLRSVARELTLDLHRRLTHPDKPFTGDGLGVGRHSVTPIV